jgi:hypothetical protein
VKAPRSERSPLWLQAELTLYLTPWSWRLRAWRSGRNLTVQLGPVGLTVLDG